MQELLAWAREVWPLLISALHISAASWVTVDAVLRKRHAPSVVSWVGLAWLAPISSAAQRPPMNVTSASSPSRSATAMRPDSAMVASRATPDSYAENRRPCPGASPKIAMRSTSCSRAASMPCHAPIASRNATELGLMA